MSREVALHLASLTERAALEPGRSWFAGEFARAFDSADIRPAFAGAGRRLGAAKLATSDNPAAYSGASLSEWTVADAGRVALLLAAVADSPLDRARLRVEDLFFRGELGEKCAVLRALSWLREPGAYVELGVEGCRTNARSLFEAIACGNPFPSRWFPEPSFNQMVMKALFLGVPAASIVGLEHRATPTLARMASDYASERRAAGRSVPGDVARILALSASQPELK